MAPKSLKLNAFQTSTDYIYIYIYVCTYIYGREYVSNYRAIHHIVAVISTKKA